MGNHLCSSLNAAFAQKNIFHPALQCTVQYFIPPQCTVQYFIPPQCTVQYFIPPQCSVQYFIPPQCTVQYFIPPYSVLYNISYFKYNAESPKQGSKRFNSNVKTINIVPLGIIYLCRRQSKERLGGQMFGRRRGVLSVLLPIYILWSEPFVKLWIFYKNTVL